MFGIKLLTSTNTEIKREVRTVFVVYVFDDKTEKNKDDIGNFLFIHVEKTDRVKQV